MMISKKMFFQSRFARRIISIFISCSIIPLLALFVLSYQRITEDLKNQNLLRLKQATKSISISVYERLLFLEAEMQLNSRKISRTADPDFARPAIVSHQVESDRFRALAIYRQGGKKTTVFGDTANFPALSNPEHRALQKTGATIITRRPSGQLPKFFMAISDPRRATPQDYVLGEINREYFRQVISENLLPAMTDFIILDDSQDILVASIKPERSLFENMANFADDGVSGHFSVGLKGKAYRAGFNKLFLKPQYSIPGWTVVLLQPEDYTLQSLHDFKTIFPLVILLSLLIVIFLTLIFVRKSLVSLEKLKEGTLRIVEGNFKDIDNISSGDEFGDLADAFNIMANKLTLQLNELSLSAAIGHYSTKIQDSDAMIDAILNSVKKHLNFDRAALIFLNPATSRLHYKSGYGYEAQEKESFTVFFNARRTVNADHPIGKALLSKQPVFTINDDKSAIRRVSEAATWSGKQPDALSIYVPIVYEDQSMGALVLENAAKKRIPITIDSGFLGGLGSQIAVCLSNNTSRQKLQESEERFRKAFDNVAAGIALVSPEGEFLAVNAYLLKMLGYGEKEFLHKTLRNISNPAHFLAENNSRQRLLKKEIESDIYEKLFIHKSGHQIWGLVSISLLFDQNDQPLYYIMNVQNLTELKEAEKIQKELESRLQNACR